MANNKHGPIQIASCAEGMTTAYTLSAGIHHLGSDVKLQTELREEVTRHWPENLDTNSSNLPDFVLDLEELSKFPKIRAFMKECLRIYSPIPFIVRTFDMKMSNFSLISQVNFPIFILPDVVHRDPRFWRKPEKFDISRWLDDEREISDSGDLAQNQGDSKTTGVPSKNPTLSQNSNVFTFLPFSIGKRNYIGQNFAMNNLMVASIYLLKFYTFESTEKQLKVDDQVVYSALNCFVKFSAIGSLGESVST